MKDSIMNNKFINHLMNKVQLVKGSRSNPRYDVVVTPVEAKTLIEYGACNLNFDLVDINARISCGENRQFWFAFSAKKYSKLRAELNKRFERKLKRKS